VTGAQARMARAALQLGVRDLAALAKVSPNTVTRIEAGLTANSSTLAAVRTALESAGVIFVEENGEGPGVRLRKAKA
jgi:transcriptional regulator with XRE-family HTH domain